MFTILRSNSLQFRSIQDSLFWWLADQQRPTCSDNYLVQKGTDNLAFAFGSPGSSEIIRFTAQVLAEDDPMKDRFLYIIETKQLLLYVKSPEALFELLEHAVDPLKQLIYDM